MEALEKKVNECKVLLENKGGGATAQIREVVQKVESKIKHATPGKQVRKVLRVLKKKDKEEIVQAVLEKYYDSEELKPYQAELIKMQHHLERTGKKMVILFDGRDARVDPGPATDGEVVARNPDGIVANSHLRIIREVISAAQPGPGGIVREVDLVLVPVGGSGGRRVGRHGQEHVALGVRR